jgi:hypothetical protein
VPQLLPYRCNRVEQTDDLVLALRQGFRPNEPGPHAVICLLHAEESQAMNKFLKCLKDDLGNLLGVSRTEAVTWKEIPWPIEDSAEAVRVSFMRKLLGVLQDNNLTVHNSADPKSVAALLDRYQGMLVLHSRVYTDKWDSDRALALRSIIEYWRSIRLEGRRLPVLILFSIEYRDLSGPFGWMTTGRNNRLVRASVVDLAARHKEESWVAFPRELSDVLRVHADVWAESEPVQEILQGADIQSEVAAAFQGKTEMPMRPLAEELLVILKKTIEGLRA